MRLRKKKEHYLGTGAGLSEERILEIGENIKDAMKNYLTHPKKYCECDIMKAVAKACDTKEEAAAMGYIARTVIERME